MAKSCWRVPKTRFMPPRDPDVLTEDRRRAVVMAALDTVMDPELDESVAEMGFVETIAFTGNDVDITFRLPTFWCSANFAFLMAGDMRCAVEQLDGIEQAHIRLVDHFAARKINHGVANGLGFDEAFDGEASAGLDGIRRKFRQRAFLGRQEKLLRPLAVRLGTRAAVVMSIAGLHALARDRSDELQPLALRYLTLRRHEADGHDAAAPAFIALDGHAIALDDYPSHLRRLRSLTGAAEANAEMCRIYLQARISHPAPGCEADQREGDGDMA